MFENSPFKEIKSGYKNYFNFSARSSRPELWYFVIYFIVAFYLFSLLDVAYFGTEDPVAVFSAFFFLANIIPLISLQVRRLHDVNRSGMWYFLIVIPFVGSLTLLYFYVQPSFQLENSWGEPSVN